MNEKTHYFKPKEKEVEMELLKMKMRRKLSTLMSEKCLLITFVIMYIFLLFHKQSLGT